MENNESAIETVKKIFHKEVAVKSEITGGEWNAKTNTYSSTDAESGVTTEYKLKKNDELISGYEVKTKFYKDIPDESGQPVKTQVKFDDARNMWIKTDGNFALKDLKPKKKMMGSIVEHTNTGITGKNYTLTVEPARYVESPNAVPVFIPGGLPPGMMKVG